MKIRKAVFPAAGLGTRFLPATKAQPKEMLPLVDKPIIQYVVEEAVASGLTNIIIVTGRGKNAIEDHFDVSYVRQKETLGLGHAVLMAKDLVADEPFAVMLGDDIIDSAVPCMQQMVDVFERHGGPVVAVQEVPRSEISAYGVIDGVPEGDSGRVYRIRDMVEKPRAAEAPSDLAIIGRYILTPDIFEILESTPRDKAGEIQLTNGLRNLKDRRPVFGYRFEGVRHDAGNKLGFLKATVEFALKRADLGTPFREYLRSLKL